MIATLAIAVLALVVITAMHLSHKDEIRFVKLEALKALEDREISSYRRGWMHGLRYEKDIQKKAIDHIISSHLVSVD